MCLTTTTSVNDDVVRHRVLDRDDKSVDLLVNTDRMRPLRYELRMSNDHLPLYVMITGVEEKWMQAWGEQTKKWYQSTKSLTLI